MSSNPLAALLGEEPTNPVADHRFVGTFATFKVYRPEQQPVVDLLSKLAERVIGYAPQLVADENPFTEGKILSITGQPGRGKSHLTDAFINKIKDGDPRALSRVVYQSRAFKSGPLDVTKPIWIIDDLYAGDSDSTSVKQLDEEVVKGFMQLATQVWENRVFLLLSCNYPILEPMFQRIRAVDMVGRGASRLNGLMAASKEIPLLGDDYRAKLASERRAANGDAFDI